MRCRWSWLTKLTLLVTIAVQLRAPPLVGASSGVEMFLQSVSDGGNSASDGPLEVPLRVDLATVSPGWGDLGLLRAATGICPADGSCAMCDFVDENPCQLCGMGATAEVFLSGDSSSGAGPAAAVATLTAFRTRDSQLVLTLTTRCGWVLGTAQYGGQELYFGAPARGYGGSNDSGDGGAADVEERYACCSAALPLRGLPSSCGALELTLSLRLGLKRLVLSGPGASVSGGSGSGEDGGGMGGEDWVDCVEAASEDGTPEGLRWAEVQLDMRPPQLGRRVQQAVAEATAEQSRAAADARAQVFSNGAAASSSYTATLDPRTPASAAWLESLSRQFPLVSTSTTHQSLAFLALADALTAAAFAAPWTCLSAEGQMRMFSTVTLSVQLPRGPGDGAVQLDPNVLLPGGPALQPGISSPAPATAAAPRASVPSGSASDGGSSSLSVTEVTAVAVAVTLAIVVAVMAFFAIRTDVTSMAAAAAMAPGTGAYPLSVSRVGGGSVSAGGAAPQQGGPSSLLAPATRPHHSSFSAGGSGAPGRSAHAPAGASASRQQPQDVDLREVHVHSCAGVAPESTGTGDAAPVADAAAEAAAEAAAASAFPAMATATATAEPEAKANPLGWIVPVTAAAELQSPFLGTSEREDCGGRGSGPPQCGSDQQLRKQKGAEEAPMQLAGVREEALPPAISSVAVAQASVPEAPVALAGMKERDSQQAREPPPTDRGSSPFGNSAKLSGPLGVLNAEAADAACAADTDDADLFTLRPPSALTSHNASANVSRNASVGGAGDGSSYNGTLAGCACVAGSSSRPGKAAAAAARAAGSAEGTGVGDGPHQLVPPSPPPAGDATGRNNDSTGAAAAAASAAISDTNTSTVSAADTASMVAKLLASSSRPASNAGAPILCNARSPVLHQQSLSPTKRGKGAFRRSTSISAASPTAVEHASSPFKQDSAAAVAVSPVPAAATESPGAKAPASCMSAGTAEWMERSRSLRDSLQNARSSIQGVLAARAARNVPHPAGPTAALLAPGVLPVLFFETLNLGLALDCVTEQEQRARS
eukprot:XP_001695003.1 predicted protein [Chlamydomonas reinhardtii]